MKSFGDIQQDIRKLETQVGDIMSYLKNIKSDMEKLENSKDTLNLDFEKIRIFAKQIPYSGHPILLMEEGNRHLYLTMLMSIIKLDMDKKNTINRLIFLQWIMDQEGGRDSVIDLYRDSMAVDTKFYYEFVCDIPELYKKYFVVDALIIANITGSVIHEVYEYMTEIFSILNIDSEEIKELALISKVALSQDTKQLSQKQIEVLYDRVKDFKHYLNQFSKTIQSETKPVIYMSDEEVRNFRGDNMRKWKVFFSGDIGEYIKRLGGFFGANRCEVKDIEEYVRDKYDIKVRVQETKEQVSLSFVEQMHAILMHTGKEGRVASVEHAIKLAGYSAYNGSNGNDNSYEFFNLFTEDNNARKFQKKVKNYYRIYGKEIFFSKNLSAFKEDMKQAGFEIDDKYIKRELNC